jgi:RHS repeat-associated protein
VEIGSSASPNHYKFSGKDRDAASGLDDFGARYYSSVMGRFMTPDWSASPEPVPYAKLDSPQTLNLYSYVENNPLTGIDADGHCPNGNNTGTVHDDYSPSLITQAKPACPESLGIDVTKGQGASQPSDQKLTNVVYNESGSLRANSKVKADAKGSAEDLAKGRQAISEIANRVVKAGHPNRVAPSDLRDNAAMKTNAYALPRTAADAALKGSNISNGATQYRTRVGNDVTTPVGRSTTNPGTPVSQYGPFIE